jgi:orotate phosphoribosyltransferase
MKNPLKQDDNSGILIAGLAIGAIAAAAITYLYLKRSAELKAAAQELKAHAKDYLKVKSGRKKKHKSDVDELEPIREHITI